MRMLLTFMLLAAAMLPALGQANICDRTPQVRDEILWELKADDCAAVDSEALASVQRLLIEQTQLTTLQADDFDGLTRVWRLSLVGNQLTTLPEGVFDGLTSLENLDLSADRWATLPAGVFDGLTSLEWLQIGFNNQLTELPAGLFDGLTSLQHLHLYHNQLAELPAGLFDGLTSLEGLSLNDNHLSALPAGLFDGLTSLKVLDLSNNHLVDLTPNDPVFAGLPSGVDLRLGGQTEPPELVNICDRTPELRRIILGALFRLGLFNESGGCAAVDSSDLASITSLNASVSSSRNQEPLTNLQAGDFDGLTNLETLDLSGNQLAELPEGLFDGLTSLRTLLLYGNRLTELPEGLFAGLTSLETLWLYTNRLTALPEGLFAGLTSLDELHLKNNFLTALPEGLFAGLTSLDELFLNSNRLTALPEGLFAGLTSLRTLHLYHNRLTALPEGLFAGLTSLESLYLNDNFLTALPEGLFAGLTSLDKLYLYNNHLVDLTQNDSVFAGLPDGVELLLGGQTEERVVTPLTVSVCDRTPQVRDQIIRALRQLSLFNKSGGCAAVDSTDLASIAQFPTDTPGWGRQLTTFQAGDFDGLTRLGTLSVREGQLTELPEGLFDDLISLTFLTLQNNQLTALPEGLFDSLTSLKTLHLNNNQLTMLPKLDSLTSLKTLHLNDNQLTMLPKLDSLTSLETLHLNDNQLTMLPKLNSLTSLRFLRLHDNRLTALPEGGFAGLTRLQSLRLQRNRLTALPEGAFDGLARLLTLNLYYNQLAALPEGVFDDLINLRFLQLGSNKLSALPEGVFAANSVLRTLVLSDNKLTALPDGMLDGMWILSYLDISGNHLVGFEPSNEEFRRLGKPEFMHGVRRGNSALIYHGQTELVAGVPVNICDRTPQVRDAIMRAYNYIDCTAAPLTDRLFSRYIRLDNKRLTTLQADDFDGLTHLEEIDLSGNQLTELPESLFDGMASLEGLWLHENQLTELPEGLFAGLTSLETLYLYDNRLTELPEGLFDGLASLTMLQLDENQLTALPEGLFAGLASLEGLWLYENQLTTLPEGLFDGLASLEGLWLYENQLTTLPEGLFAGLASLVALGLHENRLTTLPEGLFDGLTSLETLWLYKNQLTTLPEGLFAGSTSLEELWLHENQLTELPEGLFDGLTSLETLWLSRNRLTELPEGLFASLTSLEGLWLQLNQLTTLPEGLFAGLTSLERLLLRHNWLAELPEGLFAGLTSLELLHLYDNRLATLPEGLFAGLTSLRSLLLNDNRLATLPEGLFAGLTDLRALHLNDNRLTGLPEGLFDDLTSLQGLRLQQNQLTELPEGLFDNLPLLAELNLNDNRLTELPEGLFDNLVSLRILHLRGNHLVELTRDDLPGWIDSVFLGGQTIATEAPETPTTNATRLAAAVPLMLSALDPMGQGFVRIINESDESGGVRILAFDDGGVAAEPIEIQLGANQVFHFNSNDLENGNASKGIAGMGSPVQGDWRLDVETALDVRVLAFVRTNDGFLTAMHDRLPRDGEGRLAAQTFNPGSNANQVSKLRLVNTGADAEGLSIEGVDDQGNSAGPVTLTLAAGESRTLSAFDLENGAQGLTGMLGDGAGKWRLFIDAGQPVVGLGLLEAASGHLTNISTMGVASAERLAAAVPLMLSASDSMGQGFVRIINESDESGSVRILAFGDGGAAAEPIEIQLGASQVLHFNSNDLENGNASKGIVGMGSPVQGDWRLDVETALDVRVLAFVRTNDGFLTAMHDVLPRDADGWLAAQTFNPGSNANQVSKLRLVNTGADAESLIIEGVDDQGNSARPVTLTLAAGESRTLSAFDLENGAQGLTGTLGDGAGKWRLFIDAGQPVVGLSLLEAASGHLTNISTMGVASAERLAAAVPHRCHDHAAAGELLWACGSLRSSRPGWPFPGADGAGGVVCAQCVRPVRHAMETYRRGSRTAGTTTTKERREMEVHGRAGMRRPRLARWFLEQPPEEHPLRVPQQVPHRLALLQQRFPRGPDAHAMNPHLLASVVRRSMP